MSHPGIPVTVKAEVPLKRHMEDGDYTVDFLEAGTKMYAEGDGWKINGDIPVTSAVVKDDVLYIEGGAT